MLPYALGCFRKKYRGVSIDLQIASSADVIEWLLAGRVGLAVVGVEPDDERLEADPFVEDEIVGVAKPGLLPVDDGTVSVSALSAETLLAGEPGSSTQALADKELRAAGVNPKTVWRLGSGEGVKRSALEGLGFAFLSRFAVAEELEQGRLENFRIVGRKPPALPRRPPRQSRAHTGGGAVSLDAVDLLCDERSLRRGLHRPSGAADGPSNRLSLSTAA